MIAIFYAFEQEIRDLKKTVRPLQARVFPAFKVRQGFCKGREILLAMTGIGRETTEKAVDRILSVYPVDLAISAGFSGALNEKARVGDIAVYSGVEWGKEKLNCDAGLVLQALSCPVDPPLKSIWGIGVTTEEVCMTTEARQRLTDNHQADFVDMESYWIGWVARERKIPFLCIRSIFDAFSDDLTPVAHLISGDNNAFPWQAAGEILSDVKKSKDLFYFYLNYRKAAKSLASFMERLMEAISRFETEKRNQPMAVFAGKKEC